MASFIKLTVEGGQLRASSCAVQHLMGPSIPVIDELRAQHPDSVRISPR
jgi:hypothetical protein